MAEQRLPIVNGDDGVWGTILRQYLMKEHYNGDADFNQATSTNGGHQFVTIRPGTTSAAPLTFASGSLLSTAAAGSVEYDGTYYYLTTSSATRMQIVTNTAAQTLTNKTLTAPKIDTIADTNGTNLISLTTTASATNYLDIKNNSAGLSPTISAVGTNSNIHINLIPKGVSGRITENGVEVTTISRVQTFTNKTLDNTNTVALKDTNFTLQDNGDATKQLQFDLASVTAGHTTTLAVPEVNGTTTIVGTDIAQNLSSKTINLANNTVTGTMAQFNAAVSDGDIDYALTPTAIKTSNYTAAANELVLVDCGAANIIVSLPTSPADGTKVGITQVGLSSTGKTVTMRATGTAKFNISIDGVFANWTDLPASIVTTVQYSTASQRWTVLEYQQTQTSVAEATHAGSADTLTTSRTFQTNLASTSAVGFNGSANNVHGVTGTLPVANGGTGATTFTSGNVLTGAGTSAVTATKAAPSGAFVGTTDTQVLSGKTIDGSSNTLSNVPMSALGTGKVTGSVNGTPTSLTLWKGTQAQYNALGTYDANTVYVVTTT